MSPNDSVRRQTAASNIPRLEKFLSFARQVPLLGPLVECRASDHAETFKQVFVTLVLATTPFWLGALVLFATDHLALPFSKAFFSTVWDGELFMTATGLLAPIFWITAEDPRGAAAFPSRLAHVLITVLLSAVASVFFALGIVNRRLREPFTFHLSIGIFFVASVLLYLSTVYHLRRLPDSVEAYRTDEEDFAVAYERHRA